VRFVETQKVVGEWGCVFGPFAKVEVCPRCHFRLEDTVVPGEQRNDPNISEAERLCSDVELVTQFQNQLKLLDGVDVCVSNPQLVIAGCEEKLTEF
jgi:hypothetical protein